MPFIPAPNCAKVAVEGILNGQRVVETFWFYYAGVMDITALEALAQYVGTTWWGDQQSSRAAHYQMTQVTATDQSTQNGVQGIYIPAVAQYGTGGGLSVANNAACCFSFRSLYRGRSYRGRNYAPGIVQSALVNETTWNATTIGNLAATYVARLITGIPTGWTWVVVSHFANKIPRVTAIWSAIFHVVVDNYLDSQRRRLAGRGR